MSCSNIFSLCVAIDENGLIGYYNKGSDIGVIPWRRLDEDMKHFKEVTDDSYVILGRKTWESMPNSYKSNRSTDRKNIIISSKMELDYDYSRDVVDNFDLAISYSDENMVFLKKKCVIGGATIYRKIMENKLLNIAYITIIDGKIDLPKDVTPVYFPLNKMDIDILIKLGIFVPFKTTKHKQGNISYTINCYNVNNLYKLFSNDNWEVQYLSLIKKIMHEGTVKVTRNAITKSIFGAQIKCDLSKGFPITTIKKCFPRSIFEELMWFIRGQTNVELLRNKGIHIWDGNSNAEYLKKYGFNYREWDIGPGYGFQIRHSGAKYVDCLTDYSNQGFDQLLYVIDQLNNNPNSRRILINLWNPADTDAMALPPCHIIYNFSVDLYEEPINGSRGKLNCHLFQRSWDILLGWNHCTAAMMTHLLANHCNLDVGILVHSISDVHVYQSHIDTEGFDKLFINFHRPLPKLYFKTKKSNIDDYEFDDIVIDGYEPHDAIRFKMVA